MWLFLIGSIFRSKIHSISKLILRSCCMLNAVLVTKIIHIFKNLLKQLNCGNKSLKVDLELTRKHHLSNKKGHYFFCTCLILLGGRAVIFILANFNCFNIFSRNLENFYYFYKEWLYFLRIEILYFNLGYLYESLTLMGFLLAFY